MVNASDIRWGKYSQWEGPFFLGRSRFSSSPRSEESRYLSVITATEGGTYDAVNMYDRCRVSTGILQFCESYFLTSDLVGRALEASPAASEFLKDACRDSRVEFKKNGYGRWRFFRGGLEAGTESQPGIFFLHSSGKIGTWDDESKVHAKRWAAALANILSDPKTYESQIRFCSQRLMGFVTQGAKVVLWGNGKDEHEKGDWKGAARAVFLSFAANLPSVASKHLQLHVSRHGPPIWGSEWVIGMIKELTFGPNVATYPGRYAKIRPVVEASYGVDLPDLSEELKAWAVANSEAVPGCPMDGMDSVEEIQKTLISLGFDVGPSGADGRMGPKTGAAVRDFQKKNGLVADGIVGPQTRAALCRSVSDP